MRILGKSPRKAGRTDTRARNNRQGRTGKRGKSGTSPIVVAAAVVAPLAVLGAAGFGTITLLDSEEIDANFCYARADQHQAVIFVDNSIQGQSGAQLRDYRTGLMRAYDNAPANSLIRIASTARTQGGSFAQPAHVICKPAATPAQQEAIGAPSQPAPMLARIADEARTKFEEMADQVIADASDEAQIARDSPILEQMQAISRYDGWTGPNRSLTMISDGENNSESARFCTVPGDFVPFEQFRKKRSYQYIEPRSFEGVDVTILLVEIGKLPAPGAPYCSNDGLRDWWPQYFTENGAKSVDLRRLRYWQDS